MTNLNRLSDLINKVKPLACVLILMGGLGLPFNALADEDDMLDKVEASAEKIKDLIDKYCKSSKPFGQSVV